MRLITRVLTFDLRNIRSRKATTEAEPKEKIRFSEEEITEMGQYRM